MQASTSLSETAASDGAGRNRAHDITWNEEAIADAFVVCTGGTDGEGTAVRHTSAGPTAQQRFSLVLVVATAIHFDPTSCLVSRRVLSWLWLYWTESSREVRGVVIRKDNPKSHEGPTDARHQISRG